MNQSSRLLAAQSSLRARRDIESLRRAGSQMSGSFLRVDEQGRLVFRTADNGILYSSSSRNTSSRPLRVGETVSITSTSLDSEAFFAPPR